MHDAAFHPRTPPGSAGFRRFSDPVSPLNDGLHDQTRLLAEAVKMVDGLGLRIIAVEADRARNKRIQVSYSYECDALDAVEVARDGLWSHWAVNHRGVEIRWCVPVGPRVHPTSSGYNHADQ